MENPSKKTRARSESAKKQQLQRIIQEGEQMFLKYGPRSMSMRMLARKLQMGEDSASSLYTYVSSKRELWFAIIRYNFREFENQMRQVIPANPKSVKAVLIEVAAFYFQFALVDLTRYQMMFQVPAPISKKKGKIEKEYESKSVYFLKNLVQQGINNNEFQERDADKLTFFLWGILHGPLTVMETELFGDSSQLPKLESKDAYIEFLLKNLRKIVAIL